MYSTNLLWFWPCMGLGGPLVVGVVVVGVVLDVFVGALLLLDVVESVVLSVLFWTGEVLAGFACEGDCGFPGCIVLRPDFCRIETSCSNKVFTFSRVSTRSLSKGEDVLS